MPKKTQAVEAVVPEVKPQRAALSDVTFPIFNPMIRMTASLYAVVRSDKQDEFKVLCPECTEPHKVSQRYICDADHGPFMEHECDRGREIEKDKFVRVTPEAMAEVRAVTLPSKEAATLTAFNAADVEAATFPGEKAYKLALKSDIDQELAANLLVLLKDRKVAYLTELVIRSSQKMYRLIEHEGQIVLQEVVRPSQKAATDRVVTAKANKANTDFLKAQAQVEPFNAEDWANQVKLRAMALNETLAAEDGKPKSKAKKAAESPVNGLAAMFAAAEAAAKPKKKGKAA